MELLDSFLLGLIQGLTEFLPVSSSGHLVLAGALLGGELDKSITFEVVVHFGTLCSILIYYRQQLWEMTGSAWRFVTSLGSEEAKADPNIYLIGLILLSMIPAMIIGLTMRDWIEDVFLSPVPVSIMLLVTGTILWSTRFRDSFPNTVKPRSALAIGMAQAFALLPGISRSGSTISLGLWLGIKREEVANFSFLMVIPVIAGAMVFEVEEMIQMGIPLDAGIGLLVGFLTAFVSGYFALKYLIIMLKTKGIHPFAYYCWALGGSGLLFFWVLG